MKKRLIAMALMFMLALSAVPLAAAADFTFTDVPDTHPHRAAIEYCVANNFVKGYSGTVFDPDGSLTREQFAVIWGRTLHVRMHKFNDVTKIPNEFDNAIVIMQALHHVNGISETEFGRTDKITREQAIAITQRAYLPGVDGDEEYKDYTDYAQISDWAQDAVSACKKKGVLDGVFAGDTLNPATAITRGEICHLIYNIMKEEFTITVATGIENGSVTPGKLKAYPGETITVTATPVSGYELKSGSLTANGTAITGNSFIMPYGNVVLSAEFVPETPAPVLESITVKTKPTKLVYDLNDPLVLDGLVVEATYSGGGAPVDVTDDVTTDPADGATLGTSGTNTVTVTYNDGTTTKTTTFDVEVNSAT